MIVEDQEEVLEFLSRPDAYGESGADVERIDTHCAAVFLVGDRAYKLRRAVRYDYLDYSTAELRRRMSLAEVELNRRTAPDVYRGVVPVTRRAGGVLTLGGDGEAVDWLVEMRRFDGELLFDRMAERGALELGWMAPLAEGVASFHASAERRPDHGGWPGMAWVVEGNAEGLVEHGADALDPAAVERVTDLTRAALERGEPLLEERRRGGYVRRCHGDLHLRNIVLLEGRPTLFDAVEFNDRIACVDVLYDLAFLLMDLLHRGLGRHANALSSRYLLVTDDLDGLPLLPLFLSVRAAVRAKVEATAAGVQEDPVDAEGRRRVAREYLAMAGELLASRPVRVVAVGGLSGCGKSTLAAALAPRVGRAPGALHLRSDEVRKALLGRAPVERLPPEGYAPGVTERVYAELAERALRTARAGHSAVVDATFIDPAQRQLVERAVAAAGVPFTGLWLDAPAEVLEGRLRARGADASDATVEVLRRQLARDAGDLTWTRLDAAAPAEAVAAAGSVILGLEEDAR